MNNETIDRSVYRALLFFDDLGRFPSREDIRTYTGLSDNRIRSSLMRLETDGKIKRPPRQHRTFELVR